jgi:nitrogen fixation/metabolism regulation signal transduction histidine kinase
MEAISLGKVLKDVLEGRRCVLEDQGIQVSMQVDPVTVISEERTLASVFSTILDHAIDSRLTGSRLSIEVRSRTTEDDIAVTIGHNGKRLSSDEMKEGFRAWCHIAPGQGAALPADEATLRRLVEELGGKVTMKQNSALPGARVTVMLPR